MKLTLALATTMAASTLATPVLSWKSWGKDSDSKHLWDSHKDNKWGKDNKGGKANEQCKEVSSPFTFTSTYEVKATPGQVVSILSSHTRETCTRV